jgi:hypothetical protein
MLVLATFRRGLLVRHFVSHFLIFHFLLLLETELAVHINAFGQVCQSVSVRERRRRGYTPFSAEELGQVQSPRQLLL